MSAQKLYIVHGWTYTIEPWKKVADTLRHNGIEVVQLKVPGLTSPSDNVWTIDQYIKWLERELKADPHPVVLGHSNGGRIALNLLARRPNRFRYLILLSSAGVYEDPAAVGRKRRLFRAVAKVFKPLGKIPLIKKAVYRLLGSDYGRAPKNMQQTLQNMLESDKSLAIEKVTTPTTILWGRQDTTTPIGQGRKMARLLPHAKLIEFEDWRHAPYITHPDELSKVLLDVLKGID